MSVWRRLRYAVFLTVAFLMPVLLIGALAGWDTGFLFHPLVSAGCVAFAFLVAPLLEPHLPFKRRK
jgi:uncharacterized membrane protein (DUF485 family)